MTNSANINEPPFVINSINDTVVSNPRTPEIAGAFKLSRALRAGICLQLLDDGDYLLGNG